ncbi:uncharacterized protein, partial [Penaeus vannamei]|uniref:uncharacterized protein n=1 Tax=Penaeus vannamei TaxID=6689 RepID=UPI00387F9185
IRFPRGTSIVEILSNRYGRPVLLKYRETEKTDFKIKKLNLDIEFLQTCKNYNIIPKFLQFKVYNHRFTDTKIYRSWLFKLLNYEIRQKTKQLAHESGKYPLLLQNLRNLTSFLDFNCLKGLLTRNNDKDLVRIKTRHLRKLHNLGLTPEYEVDSSKVIFNYSNRNFSEDETKLLSLGLDFALPCKSPSFADHFLAFERLCHTVNNCQIIDNSESAKLKVFEKIASLANETFYDFKRHTHWLPSFSKAKYNALKSLKEDPNIIITRPDKGKGVVILERNEYITK